MKYQDIYKRLFEAARLAGIAALQLQKDIVNEGKEVTPIQGEDVYHLAMREAKTKVDEIVQDMLLASLLPTYQHVISLDVEEKTKLQSMFDNTSDDYTLIIDPIDGTLDYLYQKDTYSICCALIHEHDIKLALVYFPAKDEAYGYCETLTTQIYHNMVNAVWDKGEPLDIKAKHPNSIIYKNSRLSNEIVHHLTKDGFTVIDDQMDHLGCPQAIKRCLYGEALAYFADTRNIRDILLGAILSKMPHGKVFDFHGNETLWNTRGRQKEIVFTIYEKEEIFK